MKNKNHGVRGVGRWGGYVNMQILICIFACLAGVSAHAAVSTSVLTNNVNPSVYGQAVIFTNTVSGGSGTPTGTNVWDDGAPEFTNSLTAGVSRWTNSLLPVGATTISAAYGGDGTYTGSTGYMTQTVNQASSAVAVGSSVNPSLSGQSVTFTATVTAVGPGAGIPSGTVTFLNDTTTLGTRTLDGAGLATITDSSIAIGTHPIWGVYNGDANFLTSTNPVALTQTVSQASTTVAVSSSSNPSVNGQSVTWTSTVGAVSPGIGTPTGTVTFWDFPVLLGSGSLSSGQATFTSAALIPGSHLITAVYGGNTEFITNTSPGLVQTVGKAGSTGGLVASPNPGIFTSNVVFTVTESAVAPGSGTPHGIVTFKDGTNTLAFARLSGGVASYTNSTLAVGSHPISTTYVGDDFFNGNSSSTVTEVIHATTNTVSSTTALTASNNPAVFGQAVVFVATVTGAGGVSNGTVVLNDGAASLATNTLSAAGDCSFTNSSLSVGPHLLVASYAGDTNFDPGLGLLTETINKDSVTNLLTSSTNPATYGQSITFTATLTAAAPGAGTPGGTVIFKDSGVSLSTNTLSAGAASFATTNLVSTTHLLTAVYSGDSNFVGVTSGVLTQVVSQASFIYVPFAGSGNVGNEPWPPFFSEGFVTGMPVAAENWPLWQGWRAFDTNFHQADARLLVLEGGLTTNFSVLVPGGLTNVLAFTNGILRAVH